MPEDLLKLLENNPWLNLVFLALAVMSVFVSISLYFASKREKKPVFNKKSFNLIKNNLSKLEGLKITFMDTEVENLTTTRVAIWNKGKDTINKDDVAPLDPIRIEMKEGKSILQADIIHRTNEVNNFSMILEDERVVKVDFDYFHKNEGIVIQLYHTGSSDKDVKIAGTVKGVGACKSAVIPEYDLAEKYLRPIIRPILPKNKVLAYTVAFLISPIFTVPFVILVGIDSVRRFFSTIPRDFELQDL